MTDSWCHGVDRLHLSKAVLSGELYIPSELDEVHITCRNMQEEEEQEEMARLNLKAHLMMMKIEMQLKHRDCGPYNDTIGGCDA